MFLFNWQIIKHLTLSQNWCWTRIEVHLQFDQNYILKMIFYQLGLLNRSVYIFQLKYYDYLDDVFLKSLIVRRYCSKAYADLNLTYLLKPQDLLSSFIQSAIYLVYTLSFKLSTHLFNRLRNFPTNKNATLLRLGHLIVLHTVQVMI